MAYKHGVYVNENATALVAPVEGTAGLQVIVGTAPVNLLSDPASAVNKPLIAYTFAEAQAAVGYSDDYEKYTLCQAMDASFKVLGVAPIILINVLDPAKHTVDLEETEIQINNGAALLEVKGVLADKLVVKSGTTVLTKDTDYTVAFDEDGYAVIAMLDTEAAAAATTLTVTGTVIDASKVTAADIVGGVSATTGEETGLEVIRQVYPKLGMTPGILLAPGWSHNATVAAALQAKCTSINGVFRCVCVVDVDSTSKGATKYGDAKTYKESAGISSENAYAVWPCAKIDDTVYYGSAIAAALMAYTDAENDDTPNVSPSNKTISISGACLADGTEVYLDQDQANTINGVGVATFLNMNGWRMWGNNTAAYPGTTDPKDRWINVRRFMSWAANTFILTYFSKVDDVMNSRLIESIVDSENMRGNSFVSRGICARYEIVYNEDENSTTELLNGHITFHQYITPFTPAEQIEDVIEFDPDALSSALSV